MLDGLVTATGADGGGKKEQGNNGSESTAVRPEEPVIRSLPHHRSKEVPLLRDPGLLFCWRGFPFASLARR